MIGFELSSSLWTTTLLAVATYRLTRIIYNLTLRPLRHIPGPWTWSATRLPYHIALFKGTVIHDIQSLHEKYGPVLRIAPNEMFIQRYVNLFVQRLMELVVDNTKSAEQQNKWEENSGREKRSNKSAKVDMTPWFNYTTFDIFGDLGFGESFDCLEHS
ncbi:uncharacterized protein BDV14DRAFT_203122 [Aspergillus stella-maris]|uniref:uncharacterized protein n=1 Tax=Aspergillus stella-maris TaxID=1810926 RepID=UPI003CCDF875